MGKISNYIAASATGSAPAFDLKSVHGKAKAVKDLNELALNATTVDGIDGLDLEIKSSKGKANGYAPLSHLKLIPNEYLPKTVGWNILTATNHGRWMNGGKSKPDDQELNLWRIGDSYGFEFAVPVDYIPGTPLYPFLRWSGLTDQMTGTEEHSQFDISVSAGLLDGKLRSVAEISIVGVHAAKAVLDKNAAGDH